MRSGRWFALAVVLLAGCGREGNATPTIASVACEKNGSTTVLTPVVRTTPFGIRVHVRNDTPRSVFVQPFGAELRPGFTDRTITRRPGVLEISCWQYLRTPRPAPGPAMIVVDPGRYWRNPVPECNFIRTVRFFRSPSTSVETGGPVEAVRRNLTGLRPRDVVERAGYRDRFKGVVRIARGGRTIAAVRLTTPSVRSDDRSAAALRLLRPKTKGFWWHEASACDHSGIGWDLLELR